LELTVAVELAVDPSVGWRAINVCGACTVVGASRWAKVDAIAIE
jgi:hypothetical protein